MRAADLLDLQRPRLGVSFKCTLIIVCLLLLRSTTDAKTLSEVCKELDHCDQNGQYQNGTKKCRYYGGKETAMFRNADPIVQEQYLRLRAFLSRTGR